MATQVKVCRVCSQCPFTYCSHFAFNVILSSLSLYFVCYLIKQQKAEMPADRQVRNKAFNNLSSRL